MSVRLFVCLVFVTKISQYEVSTESSIYNHRNAKRIVTDGLNDTPNDAVQSINLTENKTNSTIDVVPLNIGLKKNETTTKKPDANKEGLETQSSQIVNSYPPYISYEVTENVIDIPDDRNPAGPIVTNFTLRPPILNLAKPTNKIETTTDTTTEEASNVKTKKNHLSILHINAEFDDKEQEVHENKVVGFFKGIKKCIHSFQRGIVNGFHSFFHKHHDGHDHGDRFERAVNS